MTSKDSKSIAEELKLKGNKAFSAGKYEESIKFYTDAITTDSSNAVLFSNRAMANIKLKRYLDAEQDCSRALVINPSFDKAYYRRGHSRKELHRYKSALADFKKALELSPSNSEIKKEYELLKSLLNNMAKIRIQPVEKEQQFQSTSPMKEIVIQNDNVAITSDIDTDLANEIKKLVTSRCPQNYSQFEYDWRNLSSSQMNEKVEYLEMISLSAYENIFKFPFEPQMLLEVLQTLSLSNNSLLVLQVLNVITNMPRFSLSVLFFADEEFEVLGIIFRNLLGSNQVDKEKVLSLAKTFNVTIQ